MGKLLILFIVVPLIELYLLILVGKAIGLGATVAIVLVTAMLGGWLAKREGLRVLREWQSAVSEGRVPDEGVLGGLLVLVGGVLLIVPGVLTDVAGLLLLLPPTRRAIATVVRAHFERKLREGSVRVVRFEQHATDAPRRGPGGVIDVEGEVVESRSEPAPPPVYRRISEPGR